MIIAYLERHDQERNLHRYYRLSICKTLFGDYALIREWGRCGKYSNFIPQRNKKEEWYPSPLLAKSDSM